MKLYHGTSTDNAESIRNDGVIRAGNYYGGIKGVALSPRKEVAEDFACGFDDDGEVFEVRVSIDDLVVDPESVNHNDVDLAIQSGESVYYIGGDLAV